MNLRQNTLKMMGLMTIPTDEPETEHTEDDGSNDESVCVSGDGMDIEWEDN